jgi:hypothetical protein
MVGAVPEHSLATAELPAAASGLGWSQGEHPGHLLFPLFHALLAGSGAAHASWPEESFAIDEFEFLLALLDAVCLACEPAPATLRWVESIRTEYRRFPALRAEIDRRMGKA